MSAKNLKATYKKHNCRGAIYRAFKMLNFQALKNLIVKHEVSYIIILHGREPGER